MHTQEVNQEHMSTTTACGPAYRIHTHRLVLRCWEPRDAPLLIAAIAANLEHLRPWLLWAQHEPEDLYTKIERLRQYRGAFDLGQDFLNQGLATEATAEIEAFDVVGRTLL